MCHSETYVSSACNGRKCIKKLYECLKSWSVYRIYKFSVLTSWILNSVGHILWQGVWKMCQLLCRDCLILLLFTVCPVALSWSTAFRSVLLVRIYGKCVTFTQSPVYKWLVFQQFNSEELVELRTLSWRNRIKRCDLVHRL